jgi:myo-inositol-1(or 4)-monophosphatase
LEKVRETVFKAVKAGGALLRERWGKVKNIDYKGAYNIVTDVDKASELLILSILQPEFPDVGVLAEEGGAMNAQSDSRWLIDPLDGTTNYAHAYPFFAVSIGFEVRGEMKFGAVFNPISNELFWAEQGKGAFLNDEPIRVSSLNSLNVSLLATGFPPDTKKAHDDNMVRFRTLTDMSHGVRRDGSAALDLSFVACGRFDGFWELKLSPWDTAAGSLLVREAGGSVTNIEGGPFDITTGHILATNGHIHDEVVEQLRKIESQTASAGNK